MKEIVIISGKGGTGKTSLAAALAFLSGQEAIIADCDVDAADMHLLLSPDFGQAEDFVTTIKLAASSDPIRFNKTALRIITHQGSATLTYGGLGTSGYATDATFENGTYMVEYVRRTENSYNHILKQGEVARVYHGSPTPLVEGGQMELSYIPTYGDESMIIVVAPEVMTANKVKLYP